MQTASPSKRVRVLYIGGLSEKNLTPKRAETILSEYLELQFITDTDVVVFKDKRNVNVDWNDAVEIGRDILSNYDQYDGFVVLHPVENSVYMASFLQFIVTQLGKPIIFTGALSGATSTEDEIFKRMDLRTNLVSAVQLASMDCSGVLIAYGSEVSRAVRTLEYATDDGLRLDSFNEDPVANMKFGIDLQTSISPRSNVPMQLTEDYETNVGIMDLYPGSTRSCVSLDLDKIEKAIIVRAHYSKTFPSAVELPTDIPVMIIAQNQWDIKQDNIVVLTNATFPAVLAKTMVLLKDNLSTAEFMIKFKQSWHNEFS